MKEKTEPVRKAAKLSDDLLMVLTELQPLFGMMVACIRWVHILQHFLKLFDSQQLHA